MSEPCPVAPLLEHVHEVRQWMKAARRSKRDFRTAREEHHICGRQGQFSESKTNKLKVSKPVHDWCHDVGHYSRIPCLLVLKRRGLLDWRKLEILTRRPMPGYIEALDAPEWCEPLRRELLAGENKVIEGESE